MLKKKSLEQALYCVLKNVSHAATGLHIEPFDLCNWGVNIKLNYTLLHLFFLLTFGARRGRRLSLSPLFFIFLVAYQKLFSAPQLVCCIIFLEPCEVFFLFCFFLADVTAPALSGDWIAYRQSTVATIEWSEVSLFMKNSGILWIFIQNVPANQKNKNARNCF